jgi:tetratricopeptide (TPR) repeat protein
VLNFAGTALLAVGRLDEAAQAFEQAMSAREHDDDFLNAARNGMMLAQVLALRGKLRLAQEHSLHAVSLADRCQGEWFEQLCCRATHADILHNLGNLSDARHFFVEAERMLVCNDPAYRYLYAMQGYQYCDLLFSEARLDEVRRRVVHLKASRPAHEPSFHVALEKLIEAREAWLNGNGAHAESLFDDALERLRDSGTRDQWPRALLLRAAFARTVGDLSTADDLLTEATEFADRSGMRLFQIDALLERALLTLACGGDGAADEALIASASAKDRIDGAHYNRRIPDWHLVEAAIAAAQRRHADAARHLDLVEGYIAAGWRAATGGLDHLRSLRS